MNLDTETLRKLSFREFCDKWIDELDEKYDHAGEVWVELFREQIFKQMLELRQKVEKLHALVSFLESEEVYDAVISEFVKEKTLLDLPAYETMLPVLIAAGAQNTESFLAVVALLKSRLNYDERLGGNNTNPPAKYEKESENRTNN